MTSPLVTNQKVQLTFFFQTCSKGYYQTPLTGPEWDVSENLAVRLAHYLHLGVHQPVCDLNSKL